MKKQDLKVGMDFYIAYEPIDSSSFNEKNAKIIRVTPNYEDEYKYLYDPSISHKLIMLPSLVVFKKIAKLTITKLK